MVSQIQLSRGHLTGGKRLGTSAGQPWQAASNRDRPRERETVSDFIAKKKEMFLLSLSLDTKWAEIQKLEGKRTIHLHAATGGASDFCAWLWF